MFGVTENDLCGEHRFKSATQSCLHVFLPERTTCCTLFNQTRRCHSTSFWLWGDTVRVLPTSICIGFTQRSCTKSAAQDFRAAPKWCCSFSSAAPMPGTSFSHLCVFVRVLPQNLPEFSQCPKKSEPKNEIFTNSWCVVTFDSMGTLWRAAVQASKIVPLTCYDPKAQHTTGCHSQAPASSKTIQKKTSLTCATSTSICTIWEQNPSK